MSNSDVVFASCPDMGGDDVTVSNFTKVVFGRVSTISHSSRFDLPCHSGDSSCFWKAGLYETDSGGKRSLRALALR